MKIPHTYTQMGMSLIIHVVVLTDSHLSRHVKAFSAVYRPGGGVSSPLHSEPHKLLSALRQELCTQPGHITELRCNPDIVVSRILCRGQACEEQVTLHLSQQMVTCTPGQPSCSTYSPVMYLQSHAKSWYTCGLQNTWLPGMFCVTACVPRPPL